MKSVLLLFLNPWMKVVWNIFGIKEVKKMPLKFINDMSVHVVAYSVPFRQMIQWLQSANKVIYPRTIKTTLLSGILNSYHVLLSILSQKGTLFKPKKYTFQAKIDTFLSFMLINFFFADPTIHLSCYRTWDTELWV